MALVNDDGIPMGTKKMGQKNTPKEGMAIVGDG